MTLVPATPRIRCDNCGREEEQVMRTGWESPHGWEGEAYGFDDLCAKCVSAANKASAAALSKVKSEGFDGPTGAE